MLTKETIGAMIAPSMVTNLTRTLTALEARGEASLFLSDHLTDRFYANDPRLDEATNIWHVPILLAYPIIGSVGHTGEILVDATSGAVVSHTPLDDMKAAAARLIELHRDEIEAAFSTSRNA